MTQSARTIEAVYADGSHNRHARQMSKKRLNLPVTTQRLPIHFEWLSALLRLASNQSRAQLEPKYLRSEVDHRAGEERQLWVREPPHEAGTPVQTAVWNGGVGRYLRPLSAAEF